MTIKIEKISASVYKVTENEKYALPRRTYYDTEKRLYSSYQSFSCRHTAPMSNSDWDTLKSWCKAQALPFPNSEPEPSILSACEKYWAILEGTEPTSEVDTLPNPNRERYSPEVGTWVWIDATKHETLPVVKRGVPADSVNVTLANADKGMYRIEWRNSESGKTRFIVHCFGCANSLQVARGIAFAQCAKVTHPMSKPTTDLSDHP
jgi:hypothetical protein